MRFALIVTMTLLSCAANAQDIYFLGEVHDNPTHHEMQVEWVERIQPAALVFEMLSEEQAALVTADKRGDRAALAAVLDWANSGWPDFGMYHPIFTAAPTAPIFGAGLNRDSARAAMAGGFDGPMGGQAALYGLDQPLPESQQSQREANQFAAHCDALPKEMLPGMVNIQRLRDGLLARAAVQAHAETGGPVVVITGNGHARKDWGAPALVAFAAPGLELFALGQTEDGKDPQGLFDKVATAPAPDREDPCAAFQQ